MIFLVSFFVTLIGCMIFVPLLHFAKFSAIHGGKTGPQPS